MDDRNINLESRRLDADYEDFCIYKGRIRSSFDLYCILEDFLEENHPEAYQEYKRRASRGHRVMWRLNGILIDIMYEICPDNCYFGNNPMEGEFSSELSNIGFWNRLEDEDVSIHEFEDPFATGHIDNYDPAIPKEGR